ncbi:MAG: hypothetical protein PVJ27_07315 [Candidatus Brocadiaceae bacterium]
MARSTSMKMSRRQRLAERLEVIRRRHKELILQPREAIATDLAHEFGMPLDELSEADELELVEAAETGRL